MIDSTTGSAAVWSRRTEHGTGLVVGAVHTLGLGWLGPPNERVREAIVNPDDQMGVARLFLIRPDGSEIDNHASPWFGLYNPEIAAERNANNLRNVLPREDFYVAVIDSQKLDVSGLPPVVQPIVKGEVPLYDPASVTTSGATWATVEDGALVLMMGFPDASGVLTASVGRVLSDSAASDVVEELKSAGDEEGSVPYDPTVEMIIEGWSGAGMSGGAVVDTSGSLVGVLVRASGIHQEVQYVRAVRMSFIVQRLTEAFDSLDALNKEAVRGYLEPAR